MNRFLTAALVAVLVIVAGIQISNPHSYLSEFTSRIGETGSGPDARLTELRSIGQLQTDFNRDGGHPRLVLLLSPT